MLDKRWHSAWLRGPWPVVLLLAVQVALGMSAGSRKTLTFDETAHITGGLSYWTHNDYRLHAENGNWSQRWCALPLWLAGYDVPDNIHDWRSGDVWGVARPFLCGHQRNLDSVLVRSRAMMIVPTALLGCVVYGWSRALFGVSGGLLSLALYVFSPTVLANGYLATSDLFVALFLNTTVWSLWRLLHRVNLATVGLSALSLSGLFLVKFSAVLILPMALILTCLRLLNQRPLPIGSGEDRQVQGRLRQLAVFAAVALFNTVVVVTLVWATYGFRYDAMLPGPAGDDHFFTPWKQVLTDSPQWLIDVVQFAREHHLLPEGYLYGFAYTLHYSQHRVSFLHGAFSETGFASFFPICLAIKTPLELFVLLVWAGLGAWTFRPRPADKNAAPSPAAWPGIYAVAPLAVLLAVYWWFALTSKLNIGHRHLLPTYPAMFILAGAATRWFQGTPPSGTQNAAKSRRDDVSRTPIPGRIGTIARICITAAIALAAFESLWIWPDYLAYFNPLIGGPRQGYRWLADSSLDWGQDLKELTSWLDAHPDESGDQRRVYLSYFGTVPPGYYGLRFEPLPCFFIAWEKHIPKPLSGGVYCISASMLDSVYTLAGKGRWNAAYEAQYRDLRGKVMTYWYANHDPATKARLLEVADTVAAQGLFGTFEQLRFSRLASFLRQREPDEMIGYSILIYRLSDEEVKRAVDGEPCELLPEPEK